MSERVGQGKPGSFILIACRSDTLAPWPPGPPPSGGALVRSGLRKRGPRYKGPPAVSPLCSRGVKGTTAACRIVENLGALSRRCRMNCRP